MLLFFGAFLFPVSHTYLREQILPVSLVTKHLCDIFCSTLWLNSHTPLLFQIWTHLQPLCQAPADTLCLLSFCWASGQQSQVVRNHFDTIGLSNKTISTFLQLQSAFWVRTTNCLRAEQPTSLLEIGVVNLNSAFAMVNLYKWKTSEQIMFSRRFRVKKLGTMVEAKTEARVETEQGYSHYWESQEM